MIVFYEYLEQPPYWIAHDEDGYWLVPVREQGWHEREMFVGRVPELRKIVAPLGVDLGLPDGC
jgi:glucose-6-phosphate 1-epimerase